MNLTLGTLHIVSAYDSPHLLAPSLVKAFKTLPDGAIGVAEIDPMLSDTAAFCSAYQIGLNQAVNCVILQATRGDKSWLAACVILGSMRADVNDLARRTLDARKVSFAPMDTAVRETGMEYGAITPVGLPADWSILVDKAVVNSELVIIGSGIRKSKLVVPGGFLATLPNVQVLEGLGR